MTHKDEPGTGALPPPNAPWQIGDAVPGSTEDGDRCEVCGLTVECAQCLLDAAAAYDKITPEQEALERAKLPPRVCANGANATILTNGDRVTELSKAETRCAAIVRARQWELHGGDRRSVRADHRCVRNASPNSELCGHHGAVQKRGGLVERWECAHGK